MVMMSIGCADNKVCEGRKEVLEEMLIDYNHSITRVARQEEEGVLSDLSRISLVFHWNTAECAVMQFP
jgi:hypothetical protein